jgi:hypothetical protein
MRKLETGGVIVGLLALVSGLVIGFVDSRPTWDDTGITVGALVLSAGLLSLVRPRSWWRTGPLVGLPVPVFNYFSTGNVQSAVALIFALAAAGIGALVGKALWSMSTTE